MNPSKTTAPSPAPRILLLGRTSHPDWPSLARAVLSHVQQAAHEAPPPWHSSQQNRQVRLEIAPGLADTHTFKSQTRGITQSLGRLLEKDLAVRSFRVVKGREVQKHRLLLSGF